jgi:hypothetical protein
MATTVTTVARELAGIAEITAKTGKTGKTAMPLGVTIRQGSQVLARKTEESINNEALTGRAQHLPASQGLFRTTGKE